MEQIIRKIIDLLRKVNIVEYDWENLDWDDNEQVRQYFKDNMAEGYLSEEEEAAIDKVFDERARRMALEENLKQIITDIQSGKVN